MTTTMPAWGEPWLRIGAAEFRSRLIVGIEQYDSVEVVRDVLQTTGADVFITTVDPDNRRSSLLLSDLDDALDLDGMIWVGTTSFARSREGALAAAHVLRDSLGIEILKLDVRGEDNLPDNRGTVAAAEQLRGEGMELLPFILPEVATALELQELGCAALRIMASPVGSGAGLLDPVALRGVIDAVSVPVVVEGGLGSAQHVAIAMELGADATLVNTALIRASRPLDMALAMRHAAIAGGLAAQAGPMAEPAMA